MERGGVQRLVGVPGEELRPPGEDLAVLGDRVHREGHPGNGDQLLPRGERLGHEVRRGTNDLHAPFECLTIGIRADERWQE